MRFLLNENIGKLVDEFLRSKGHDVKSAIEELKGYPDEKILRIANQEDRILVTLDQDFGEMIYRTQSPHRGVILLKMGEKTTHFNGWMNCFAGFQYRTVLAETYPAVPA